MTYDRQAIMLEAWAIVGRHRAKGCRDPLHVLLRSALKFAWYSARLAAELRAKSAAADAERCALEARSSADLDAEITALENRSMLGQEGMDRLRRLKAAQRVALKREATEADQAAKRRLIASSGSRFCTVTFRKKDGSLRQMRVQPASLKLHVKGDAATDAGRKGAVTRAARHPHLLPVWDAGKGAIRSINLDTVSRIAVNGAVHEYRA